MADRRTRIDEIARHFDDLSEEYDDYARRRISYVDRVDDLAIDCVASQDPCRYLDVGCGTGRLLRKLRDRLPESRGHGVDVSPKMVEHCQGLGLDVTCADFIDFQPGSQFDALVLEFNVFGYLIVQNGLLPTLDHMRKLVGDRGSIVFDILNPYCVTHGSLQRTLPTALGRWFQLRRHGGVYAFEYAVKGNPVTMGMVDESRVAGYFRELGYAVDVHRIEYTPHRLSPILPAALTTQTVFSVRSQ